MLTDTKTSEFLGIDFANLTYEEVACELDTLSEADSFSYVVTPNVDHVVMLHECEDEGVRQQFKAAYEAAALRLCDSRILQVLAKLRGIELEVVTGSDLTNLLLTGGHLNGKKVAIIGGDKEMLPELHGRFPEVHFVQHIPPMGVLRHPRASIEIEEFLVSAPCDYSLFAFGAPQSEIVANLCVQGGRACGVGLCIGASIEFVLGRKARAPRWIQKASLEWAFRLACEPRRLLRRYLISGPRIFKIWTREM
ncbi:WecB/TagA/CpsF family glycosyltransferase [Microcoleus sp. Pol14D5]